jgi:hypothetical protein
VWSAGPRFSNGYGAARHLATVLVENHSLKPYEQRVLGTYVLLAGMLRTLADHGAELREATAQDRSRRSTTTVLTWVADTTTPAEQMDFLAVGHQLEDSPASGGERLRWTGEPQKLRVPRVRMNHPGLSATMPRAYWIPAAWPEVIDRLRLHGVELEILTEPRQVEVEMYRLSEPVLETEAYEGHVHLAADTTTEVRREIYAPGSARVPLDQDLGTLVMLLLEPASSDSFLQWGFFSEILQRTEYAEAYVLESLAARMLAEDAALAREFQLQLQDESFAADPERRLQWFYRRTPWFDERWRLYPVGREMN